MKSNRQVSLVEKRNTLRTTLSSEGVMSQIKMALPRHMDASRMFRVAMTAVQRTPALLDCSPESVVKCVIEAAQLGLEPDGVLGHAYLIPFRNSRTNSTECQLMPGYKGLVELARRSGTISTIYAHVVHEKDRWQFEFGLHPKLRHTPSDSDDPGKVKACYAVAHMKDGGVQFDWMWTREIEKIRSSSRAANSGPWVTHWEEMAKKTVLRRLCKLLPVSVELQRVVAADEYADAGIVDAKFDFAGTDQEEVENGQDARKAALDQLADRLGGGKEAEEAAGETDAEAGTADTQLPLPSVET